MKDIRELAQHLDISIGTVSRALNNRPDVNKNTRKRVLEAALQFGYVPNQSGRSLRRGNTNAIGLMLELGTEASMGGDNFFMGVSEGIQEVIGRHNLDLILMPCGLKEDAVDYLQRMTARRFVDGLIISATRYDDPRIDFLIKSKIPFVTLGRSGDSKGFSWIDLDFAGVAYDAVMRLAAKGHRRIALANNTTANLGRVFAEGYHAGLAAAGLDADPALLLEVGSSEEGGAVAGRHMLAMDARPTAVILVHELMAVGLYHILEEAGVRPGEDMAIVGFRESPHSRFLRPNLSAYRLSLHELGVALGEALINEMPQFSPDQAPGCSSVIWPMEYLEGMSDPGPWNDSGTAP
jgi:DNA-binding LacI/PurR family transcriptional regulator